MKNPKYLLQCLIAMMSLLFACSALANGKINIHQDYVATSLPTNKLGAVSHDSYGPCGYGTHIKVINRSDYVVFVRIPASGDPDFILYPAYEGDNRDYIDSRDYYPWLRIIILASNDQTVLFDGRVQNCQTLYVDNPYYGTQSLKISL